VNEPRDVEYGRSEFVVLKMRVKGERAEMASVGRGEETNDKGERKETHNVLDPNHRHHVSPQRIPPVVRSRNVSEDI